MILEKRRRFVYALVAWMVSVILLLTTLDALELELFFVISLIGLLVVVELTAPFNVTPRWRRRLLPIILVGLAGFSYIVIRRILEILPESVF
jgi:glucose-6-phosphate-specific signal transduction histidine kinase